MGEKDKEKKKEVKKIEVIINGEKFEAEHREFKSGRKGYGVYGRIVIENYPHRISMNIIEM